MNQEDQGEPRGTVIQRVTEKLEDENTAGDYTFLPSLPSSCHS